MLEKLEDAYSRTKYVLKFMVVIFFMFPRAGVRLQILFDAFLLGNTK